MKTVQETCIKSIPEQGIILYQIVLQQLVFSLIHIVSIYLFLKLIKYYITSSAFNF